MKLRSLSIGIGLGLLASTAPIGCTDQVFTEPELLGGEEIEADVLNEGRDIYMRYCYACHGEKGDGQGPAARGLWPPPRNFQEGVFKFAGVTDEYLPDDDELMRIVRNGLTGTAMLPWDISDDELWLAIQYIKSFSQPESVDEESGRKIRAKGFRNPRKKVKGAEIPADPYQVIPAAARWDDDVLDAWIEEQRAAGVEIPTEAGALREWRSATRRRAEAKRLEVVAKGEEVYHNGGCQLCHAAYVGPEQIKKWGGVPRAAYPWDSDPKRTETYGMTLLPPDFLRHPVRSPVRHWQDGHLRYDPKDFYRVIASGIPGTAMPSWAALPAERVWAVAYFAADMAERRDTPEARERRAQVMAAYANYNPTDGTPSEGTPADTVPAEGTPAEGAPAEGTPSEGAPAEAAPAAAPPVETPPAAEPSAP